MKIKGREAAFWKWISTRTQPKRNNSKEVWPWPLASLRGGLYNSLVEIYQAFLKLWKKCQRVKANRNLSTGSWLTVEKTLKWPQCKFLRFLQESLTGHYYKWILKRIRENETKSQALFAFESWEILSPYLLLLGWQDSPVACPSPCDWWEFMPRKRSIWPSTALVGNTSSLKPSTAASLNSSHTERVRPYIQDSDF